MREPDEAFLTVGLVKPTTEPSKKSLPPDPDTPINFAFRMRHLFGLGSRAEIVRYLVTTPVTDASALGIADAAAYAKRNVNETLTSLVASGIVAAYEHSETNGATTSTARSGVSSSASKRTAGRPTATGRASSEHYAKFPVGSTTPRSTNSRLTCLRAAPEH